MPPNSLDRLVRPCARSRGLGDVRRIGYRRPRRGPRAAASPPLAVAADDPTLAPGAREHAGDALADALRAAGDEDRATGEIGVNTRDPPRRGLTGTRSASAQVPVGEAGAELRGLGGERWCEPIQATSSRRRSITNVSSSASSAGSRSRTGAVALDPRVLQLGHVRVVLDERHRGGEVVHEPGEAAVVEVDHAHVAVVDEQVGEADVGVDEPEALRALPVGLEPAPRSPRRGARAASSSSGPMPSPSCQRPQCPAAPSVVS